MNIRNRNYIKLMIWIISLISIGSIIGNLMKDNVDTWYSTLNRSELTPPNYVFGTVWSILYAMIAISGFLIWESRPFSGLSGVKRLYISQLILNWTWTPLFFGYQLTGISLICLAAIVTLVAILVVRTYKNLTTSSILLIPYLLWITFASYLNFYIWRYN